MEVPICTPREIPEQHRERASATSIRANPMNAPRGGTGTGVLVPGYIAALTTAYWGPEPRKLPTQFLDTQDTALRELILSHLNAWSGYCGIEFVYTRETGIIRISRSAGGYWSYLGTDILSIPRNRPTMNLQGFTLNTPDTEYRRVVRHEAGHSLGFPHEHMRKEIIDRIHPTKAYAYFLRTSGWNRRTVDQQVLTPLSASSLIDSTETDQTSIMCYQMPGSITYDGKPIIGGGDLSDLDKLFAARIYPKEFKPTDPDPDPIEDGDEWDWDKRWETTEWQSNEW